MAKENTSCVRYVYIKDWVKIICKTTDEGCDIHDCIST